jgi:hypothetical protein
MEIISGARLFSQRSGSAAAVTGFDIIDRSRARR